MVYNKKLAFKINRSNHCQPSKYKIAEQLICKMKLFCHHISHVASVSPFLEKNGTIAAFHTSCRSICACNCTMLESVSIVVGTLYVLKHNQTRHIGMINKSVYGVSEFLQIWNSMEFKESGESIKRLFNYLFCCACATKHTCTYTCMLVCVWKCDCTHQTKRPAIFSFYFLVHEVWLPQFFYAFRSKGRAESSCTAI